MKITATIITLNEEKNIADCLASLACADEIIVVDSGSTDRTEEICRANPKVRFFHHEWPGYGKQKNRAAELATHDWILNIDADERVSAALCESIGNFKEAGYSAARMARENYFGQRWIRHCGWYPDYTVRLYDRRVCSFSDRCVHESLEHDGRVVTMAGNLVHRTYSDISDYLQRADRYSTLAAQEMYQAGKTVAPGYLLVKPAATFIKMYLIRKGFLEGSAGFVLSVLYGYYAFCKYAKLMEIKQGSSN